MRRCLIAVLDSHPSHTDISALWQYFSSSCAYCGVQLERLARSGHLDHVVASSSGGTNDIHNHVLACGRCNGDEKREGSWQSFLARKVTDQTEATQRQGHIQAWLDRAEGRSMDADVGARAEAIIAQALRNFDAAVEQLRALRKSGT